MSEYLVEVRAVHKRFDDDRIAALRGMDLDVAEGEFVAIMGPSGAASRRFST